MKSDVNREIVSEIYRSLVLLGAESDLLSVIGSWGDTLPEPEILSSLKGWNESTLIEIKARIEHYEATSPHPSRTLGEDRRIA